MAARLVQNAVRRSGQWLPPCRPPVSALVSARRSAGGTPSPSVTMPKPQDKVRTQEDLPQVKMLETLYRMFFQGYFSRLHELQVGYCINKASLMKLSDYKTRVLR